MEPNFLIGDWIRRRRRELDLTQKDLAELARCSVAAVQKIERGERRPSRQLAELLARALEIPAEQSQGFQRAARGERSGDPFDFGQHKAPALPPAASQIPAAVTSLVGRIPELSEISRLLKEPSCRLLTLTGPGGIGKTRLAMEISHQQRAMYAHGVYFVSLVGISSPASIAPGIADALGFAFAGPQEPRQQLHNYLREKHLLLLLDNFEHLLDGAALVSDLLAQAPQVKILATSREPLHLHAEWVFEVQGLPVPTSVLAGEMEANSAATLFVQRANQARVGFKLVDEDRPALLRICQIVEGMPLGLELAAAWVRTLSVQEIAREIENHLDFLSAPAVDLPERHRSISAVIDHSWRLLPGHEQEVLQKLSVFRNGFTRDAAEQVAGAGLSLLSSLIEKSLVHRGIQGRHELHELVRQFASARLKQEPLVEQDVHKRHAEYYLTMLDASEPLLRSRHQMRTIAELTEEIDNIRSAWDWSIAHQEIELIRRATGSLYYFFELHQFFSEANNLYHQAAEMLRAALSNISADAGDGSRQRLEAALGDVLAYQAFFAQRLGLNCESIQTYKDAIGLLRPWKEIRPLTFALVHYGIVCSVVGDIEEAERSLTEGLDMSSAFSHPWLKSVAQCFLGMLEHDRGDYPSAYRWFSEAMENCRTMEDPHLSMLITTLFSRTAQAVGRLAEAEELLQEGLRIARETGNRWAIGLGLEQIAMLTEMAGDYPETERLLEEGIALHRDVGDIWSLSRTLNAHSKLLVIEGNLPEAERSALEAVRLAANGEYNLNALDSLATLADIYHQQGKNQPACELAAYVIHHPASTQATRNFANSLCAQLSGHISPNAGMLALGELQAKSLSEIANHLYTAPKT